MTVTLQKRIRRTPEQLIADLEREIERVKRRAEQKKSKKDPALRHISGAVRSIDKAASSTADATTRAALEEARTALAAVLTLSGVLVRGNGNVRSISNGAARVEPAQVERYIADHPGSRAEDIAAAFGTETAGIRPALMSLRASGAVEPKGKARATRYYASAG